jgi:hypothetical protein
MPSETPPRPDRGRRGWKLSDLGDWWRRRSTKVQVGICVVTALVVVGGVAVALSPPPSRSPGGPTGTTGGGTAPRSPNLGLLPSQSPSSETVFPSNPTITVPDVTGLPLAAAKSELAASGFDVKIAYRLTKSDPPGTVLGQDPPAGTALDQGATITLIIAKSPPSPPPTTPPPTTPPPTTPPPTTPPPPKCPPVNGNPWGYHFYCSGGINKFIYSPPGTFCNYFTCIGNFWNGQGYVEECRDGEYSKSGGRQGSCSYHGGNQQPLYAS